MRKVVIKISQGSVVTQTVLGGLTIHLPVANFLCFISAKNYENWLESRQSYCNEHRVQFFLAHPVCLIGLERSYWSRVKASAGDGQMTIQTDV